MTKPIERLARIQYEAYFSGVIGCAEPPWDQLPQTHRDRLTDSLRAVFDYAQADPPPEVVKVIARAIAIEERCQNKPKGDADTCRRGLKCGWIGKCNIAPKDTDELRARAAIEANARAWMGEDK